jgi:hypothetical protein
MGQLRALEQLRAAVEEGASASAVERNWGRECDIVGKLKNGARLWGGDDGVRWVAMKPVELAAYREDLEGKVREQERGVEAGRRKSWRAW